MLLLHCSTSLPLRHAEEKRREPQRKRNFHERTKGNLAKMASFGGEYNKIRGSL